MIEKFEALLLRFLVWREKNIKDRTFLFIVCFIIGICCGGAAVLLKTLIHYIQTLLTENFRADGANYLYLIYPAIGILLSGLFVRYIVKDDISHGVTKILYAISQSKSRIKPHNTWSSIAASSVTIGFGGSVGAEAPIVLTGAAIGSNIGRLFRLESRTLMLLVGCGAGAGIAGIFKAPIAGVVFVIEVLMLDLTTASVLPLLITSVTAATLSYILTGNDAMFQFVQTQMFTLERIPYVLMLGVVCGFFSLYFTRAMIWFEGKMMRIKAQRNKFFIGALILSSLIFLFPPLYGEGYTTITELLSLKSAHLLDGSMFNFLSRNYWGLVLFLLGVALLKVFATSATNAGGGCGGTFGPSLFLGAIVGFTFAYASNGFEATPYLPADNFALMGMAGVMAGVMHAPLLGVFLIAEITGGYSLFLPLLIVSSSSYATIMAFEKHSIYSMRLAQKGELITHHKDRAVLTFMEIGRVIERDFEMVKPDMYLGDMVAVIARSKRNIFPVTDNSNNFLGIVLLDDIRNIMFRPELYKRFKVSKFMVSLGARLQIDMTMEQAMKVFDETKAWNLPVVNERGEYVGFISRSKIFNYYRETLLENYSDD